MQLDLQPNRKGFFFFVSSDFDKYVKSVQDFWTTFERQLGRISKRSKKAKAKTGFDTLADKRKRIDKDRMNLTLFFENRLGGASICYALSRTEMLTKLVNFVNQELERRKQDGRTSSSGVQTGRQPSRKRA